MKNWDLETILRLFREGGRIALEYYRNPPTELKDDGSVVTAADREIENQLAAEFDRPEQGVYLIGEETVATRSEEYLQNALSGIAYVVDPIDGTAPYTAGISAWAISIGRMERGVLTEGAIYLPVADRGLCTAGDGVVEISGLLTKSQPRVAPFTFRPCPYSRGAHLCIPQRVAKYGRVELPNQVFAWSACVATLDGVLRGKLHASLIFCKLWDLAGCWPLLSRLGVVFHFIDGGEFNPDLRNGDSFRLAPGPYRWELRNYAVAAPTREDSRHLLEHCQCPVLHREES